MISLNRKQIGKLNTLMEHFKEVEWFTVEEDHVFSRTVMGISV